MTTTSQSMLEFPVRKSSRTRAKHVGVLETNSPRKRGPQTCASDISSPNKIKKSDIEVVEMSTPRSSRSRSKKEATTTPRSTPSRNKNTNTKNGENNEIVSTPRSAKSEKACVTPTTRTRQRNVDKVEKESNEEVPKTPSTMLKKMTLSDKAMNHVLTPVKISIIPVKITGTQTKLIDKFENENKSLPKESRANIHIVPVKTTVQTKPKELHKDIFTESHQSVLAMSPSKTLYNNQNNILENVVKSLNTPRVVKRDNFIENNDENIPSPKKSPRKRPNGCLSPRKLMTSGRDDVIKSKSPRMLVSPLRLQRADGKCYQEAKKVLHTALPDEILCREKETGDVETFLKNHLVKKRPGSLYVSGAPGTGKTAVLTHVLNSVKEKTKCVSIFVNCMTVSSSQAIYNKVASGILQKTYSGPARDTVKVLEKTLTSPGPMVLMILDEIDQLDSKNQEVLYSMFEWPTLKNSRLVLIGIANALDLTDRILPRLQARPQCKPQLINFRPYTRDQIVKILSHRLDKISKETEIVIEPSAIQFCARKVSAVAGDMRKALDVCRRAVEMVEVQVRSQQILKTSTASNSPCKQAPTTRKVSIPQINSVIQEVYGNRVTSSQSPTTIPLQQKLAICTLVLLLRVGKTKDVLLGKFHETYIKVGKRKQIIESIEQGEFFTLCQMVESRGIFGLKKAKETRMTKVTLKLDEREVEHALQDKQLMTSILYDGIPN